MIRKPDEPTDEDQTSRKGFILPRSNYSVQPPERGNDTAANVIRDKIAKLYTSEPDPLQEAKEAEVSQPRSKHQQFMYELNHSGKDLAQIQTEWHNYYLNLNDQEKHVVWQEFYDSSRLAAETTLELPADTPTPTEKLASIRNQLASRNPIVAASPPKVDDRPPEAIHDAVRASSRKKVKLTPKQHAQSLLFGLGVGAVAIFIMLFGFFNEVIIAPLIQPGRSEAATPVIVSADTIAPSSTPQVIIPKINVEIPVNYDETSTNESDIENDLESGVVHYPTTAVPGQNGNAAFFGHSSNNIFNKGKYKFAFVLLHEIVPGDTFYLSKDGKLYVYKVFSRTVVDPSDVGVLNPVTGHPATATLITCDPPGTSLKRLIIVGDQISPSPSGNSAASASGAQASAATEQLAGNGQTLWGRFVSQSYGKAIVGIVVVVALIAAFRFTSRRSRNY